MDADRRFQRIERGFVVDLIREIEPIEVKNITDLFYSLDREYRSNATFLVNPFRLMSLREWKDEAGNTLFVYSACCPVHKMESGK